MYAFDYRQLLMEAVAYCCHRQLGALSCGRNHYYNQVAVILLERMQEIAPGRCAGLTPDQLAISAGQQYDRCYRAVTGREPRAKDCLLLDKLQQKLMESVLGPS